MTPARYAAIWFTLQLLLLGGTFSIAYLLDLRSNNGHVIDLHSLPRFGFLVTLWVALWTWVSWDAAKRVPVESRNSFWSFRTNNIAQFGVWAVMALMGCCVVFLRGT